MVHEWRQGAYVVSTDRDRLDLAVIHGFLTTAYWSPGIPLAVVERAIEHSLVFGLYEERSQIGFARVVTDRATFAYVCDVFVLDAYRGRGLGTWLIESVMAHPELQGLRQWILATRDAHDLYRKVGFTPLKHPERLMHRSFPDIYRPRS